MQPNKLKQPKTKGGPTGTRPTPDPLGLAAARAAQEEVGRDTVILFGSRARGDNRPNSDVDLLVVSAETGPPYHCSAAAAVKRYFDANSLKLGVDVIVMSRDEFNYCRRAINHVAGQAAAQGVVMNGESLDFNLADYDDGYPLSWPDVKQRITNAYRNAYSFELMFEADRYNQEAYGFFAQQAVENALKAWLSAAEIGYVNTHNLVELADLVLQDEGEAATIEAQYLRDLMEYTTYPDPTKPGGRDNWLNRYAVDYRYNGIGYWMSDLEQERFYDEVQTTVHAAIERAFQLTGAGPRDLKSTEDA